LTVVETPCEAIDRSGGYGLLRLRRRFSANRLAPLKMTERSFA